MDEITLHQPPTRPWGTPSLSPFCTKLECYLRMAEIPYKPAAFGRGESPKGKMPYIKIGGSILGDSQLIIEELERRLAAEGKHPLDEGLAPRDAAIGRVVRRTLEEATYFVAVYTRWKTDAGYAIQRAEFKKWVPGIIIPLIRRDIAKKLHHQGTGRHSLDEVSAMGTADWMAVSELLGDRPFLLGDQPRTVDATVFAFLDGTLAYPLDTPVKRAVEAHANLVAYRKRIRDRWWTDLPAVDLQKK